jgi:hypothetical protein
MQKEEKNGRLSVALAAIQDDVTIVQRSDSFLSPSRLQEASPYEPPRQCLRGPLPRDR